RFFFFFGVLLHSLWCFTAGGLARLEMLQEVTAGASLQMRLFGAVMAEFLPDYDQLDLDGPYIYLSMEYTDVHGCRAH
ncbi:hypothetical protein, partial [Salmonella sp. gx-f7]|uniref:hypothetical protein n=1 Tax=Salmonella sp. gx-f7 TaxID=2582606 RepID=UPI001F2B9B92